MERFIARFVKLEAITVIPEVYAGVALVFLLLVIASVASIISLPVSRPKKLGWVAVVILLPVVGLWVYALRCLVLADYTFLRDWGLVREPSARAKN